MAKTAPTSELSADIFFDGAFRAVGTNPLGFDVKLNASAVVGVFAEPVRHAVALEVLAKVLFGEPRCQCVITHWLHLSLINRKSVPYSRRGSQICGQFLHRLTQNLSQT